MAGRQFLGLPTGDLGTGFCAKEFGSVLVLCRDAESLELTFGCQNTPGCCDPRAFALMVSKLQH